MLINCKAELKLKWTKCSGLSTAVNDNETANDANANNQSQHCLARYNQKLSKVLTKDQFIEMNTKQRMRIKI